MKSIIQSNVRRMLFVAASLTVGALSLSAETFTLSIPFAFSAANRMLPAGSYSVATDGNTLFFRGVPGSVALFAVPSITSEAMAGGAKSSAKFLQEAAGAALASVSLSNGMTYTIPVSKRATPLLAASPEGAALSHKR